MAENPSRSTLAYVASAAVIGIQVGSGIVFNLAQNEDGQFAFSPSSSLAISEFCKLLISAALLLASRPSRHTKYAAISGHDKGDEDGDAEVEAQQPARLGTQSLYGVAYLALLYAVINNCTFALYKTVDPVTIAVVKSGVTSITILNTTATSDRVLSKRQCVAITLQLCGVLSVQYAQKVTSTSLLPVHLLLVFQLICSATAGIHNKALLARNDHRQPSIALYAIGAVINVVIHAMSRLINPGTLSFFEGFGSRSAVTIILCNVAIGLATHTIYKLSEPLLKCLATAVSAGILLFIAPLVFNSPLSTFLLPGSVAVAAGVWLCVDVSSRQTPALRLESEKTASAPRVSTVHRLMTLLGPESRLPEISLAAAAATAIALVLVITGWSTALARRPYDEVATIQSPLKDTLAFIRWNHPLPERIPLIEEYRPFFRDLHISMPRDTKCVNDTGSACPAPFFNNLQADNFDQTMFVFSGIAQTMQDILDAPEGSSESTINGLLYFHFDAWVDPMGFSSEDLTKVWFPSLSAPLYECFPGLGPRSRWWPFFKPWMQQKKLMNATHDVWSRLDPEKQSRLSPTEWCDGWADIYFIPRRFFTDYINLASIYYAHEIIHEIAIPTMIHTIDVMHRSEMVKTDEVVTLMHDCWGSCCKEHPKPEDLLRYRCGHKIDLRNDTLTRVFYDKLDEHADLLGTPLHHVKGGYGSVAGDEDPMFSREANVTRAVVGRPQPVFLSEPA